MCISVICKVCGIKFPTTDLRRTVCDNPKCQKLRRQARSRWDRPEILCSVCKTVVPIGSGRRRYCSDSCYGIAQAMRTRETAIVQHDESKGINTYQPHY